MTCEKLIVDIRQTEVLGFWDLHHRGRQWTHFDIIETQTIVNSKLLGGKFFLAAECRQPRQAADAVYCGSVAQL
jgi:hypothetical protein